MTDSMEKENPVLVLSPQNGHPKDRGFPRQICSACGFKNDGSTITRDRKDSYGEPCHCGGKMHTTAFVVTDPFVDLSRIPGLIRKFRESVEIAQKDHRSFVGVMNDEMLVMLEGLERAYIELEDMVNQHCGNGEHDVYGRGLSANRDAMTLLAEVGRLKLTGGEGRCIEGKWVVADEGEGR